MPLSKEIIAESNSWSSQTKPESESKLHIKHNLQEYIMWTEWIIPSITNSSDRDNQTIPGETMLPKLTPEKFPSALTFIQHLKKRKLAISLAEAIARQVRFPAQFFMVDEANRTLQTLHLLGINPLNCKPKHRKDALFWRYTLTTVNQQSHLFPKWPWFVFQHVPPGDLQNTWSANAFDHSWVDPRRWGRMVSGEQGGNPQHVLCTAVHGK